MHVLSAGEIPLLRCFMTLLLLPRSTENLLPANMPFAAAIERVQELPSFRKIGDESDPPAAFWSAIEGSPFVVFMLGHSIPKWLVALLESKDVGVLTPSPEVFEALKQYPRAHSGLLQGGGDLTESYRVLGELLAIALIDPTLKDIEKEKYKTISPSDLFASRPRLDFIAPLPLPQPAEGRPAAYLLNRLSNNVDEPVLMGDSKPEGLTYIPQMLEWSKLACAALAALELNQEFPKEISVGTKELADYRARLISSDATPKEKLSMLLKLGQQLTADKPLKRMLLTVSAPRLDLVKGNVPENVQLDPDHKKAARTMLRAINDFGRGTKATNFRSKEEQRLYENANWTIITEQRHISCQTAFLAGGINCIPLQMSPVSGQLFNIFGDLNRALEANSRKIPALFRQTEQILSTLLPKSLVDLLARDHSPVTFFSDLPFEWTLAGEWPICLNRPVSRIPLGLSHWDVLKAVLERPVEIDTKRPERVLVFDLIRRSDPIRSFTDSFIAASNANALKYTYCSPTSSDKFLEALEQHKPDIVVLDTHASYDRVKDELFVGIGESVTPLKQLLSESLVPPLWLLSACDTSVTGAIRGTFVRELLARGAACVVATLSRVDAFTASMFVGRLLADIYSPPTPNMYESFDEVFFSTQYTTSLLYDPLLPLFRQAERDQNMKNALAGVLSEFFVWVAGHPIHIERYRLEVAHVVGLLLRKYGLTERYEGMLQGGRVRPETLLFTAFGVPGHIRLI